MMLGQSITKFLIDLSRSEGVELTAVLPCTANEEVSRLKQQIMLEGHSYVTEPCTERRDSRALGFGFVSWK
jgi:hypothetical protein